MKDEKIESKEKNSPKTPGGISKSHLTSIRRLGLSRKWKKSGISPFVSPLASHSNTNQADNAKEEINLRKRKLRLDDENTGLSTGDVENGIIEITSTSPASKDILRTNDSTPIRKVSITRKKTRIIAIKEKEVSANVETTQEDVKTLESKGGIDINVSQEPQTPLRHKLCYNSKDLEAEQSNNDILLQQTSIPTVDTVRQNENIKDTQMEDVSIVQVGDTELKKISNIICNKTEVIPRKPKKLLKECIVVIQNKIIKNKKGNKTIDLKPEVLHDSDTDDIPLSHINKMKVSEQNDNSDDDFKKTESKNSPKVQPIKKTKSTDSKKSVSKKQKQKENKEYNKSSQSSNLFSDDDDDDDVFEIKKSIFLPKTSDKLCKPVKAKSTGSITQKDIDELKARIEMKKQLLFAKAQSKDTEEVRSLIKKWRKGCQDALIELLELMRKKLPDRSDMNYANILQMLKIPPSYVGYDPENDCFSIPDDQSILTSIFSDL